MFSTLYVTIIVWIVSYNIQMKNNENIGLANDKYMQGVEKPEK